MKIELKNIKHAAFASEETDCFTATVHIDGKKEGTVSNAGKGGSNDYHPFGLYQKLKEYANTLPEIEYGKNEDGTPRTMKNDPDILIGDIFGEWISRKELRRLTNGKVAFVRGSDIYTTVKLEAPRLAAVLSDVELAKTHFKADHILNCLPEADALLAISDMKAFLGKFTSSDEAAPAAPGM